jgi:hypothetical protein
MRPDFLATTDRRLLKRLPGLLRAQHSHWAGADALLPPQHPLMVLADVDRVSFDALRVSLEERTQAMGVRKVEIRLARAKLERARRAAQAHFRQFAALTRAYHARTPWEAALPRAPRLRDGHDAFMDALQRAACLWSLMEAVPPPCPGAELVLADGTTPALFTAEVQAVQTAREALGTAAFEARLARAELAQAQEQALEACLVYPHAIRARFGSDHPLVRTAPPAWPRKRAAKRERLNHE